MLVAELDIDGIFPQYFTELFRLIRLVAGIRRLLESKGDKIVPVDKKSLMADQQSSSKVAITVAVIVLIGALGAAVIRYWCTPEPRVLPTPSPTLSKSSRMGPIEEGIRLQGSNLTPNPILVQSAEECSKECDQRDSCLAMTFVKHPNPSGRGDCWLKSAVPLRSRAAPPICFCRKD